VVYGARPSGSSRSSALRWNVWPTGSACHIGRSLWRQSLHEGRSGAEPRNEIIDLKYSLPNPESRRPNPAPLSTGDFPAVAVEIPHEKRGDAVLPDLGQFSELSVFAVLFEKSVRVPNCLRRLETNGKTKVR